MKITTCAPDCPERSPTCHATCEKYKAASEKNRKVNEERARQHRAEYYPCATMKKNRSAYYSAKQYEKGKK